MHNAIAFKRNCDFIMSCINAITSANLLHRLMIRLVVMLFIFKLQDYLSKMQV